MQSLVRAAQRAALAAAASAAMVGGWLVLAPPAHAFDAPAGDGVQAQAFRLGAYAGAKTACVQPLGDPGPGMEWAGCMPRRWSVLPGDVERGA